MEKCIYLTVLVPKLNSNVDVFDLENRIWLENFDTPTLPDPKSEQAPCLMTGPSDITTGIYGVEMVVESNKMQIYGSNQEFQIME